MAFHTHLLKPHLIFPITLVFLILTLTVSSSGNLGTSSFYKGYAFRNNQILENLDFLQNGPYAFTLQNFCKLVLSDLSHDTVIWENHHERYRAHCKCTFDAYGYLRVTGSNAPTWQTNVGVALVGDYVLVLQEDRDVVVYGPSLWSVERPNMVGYGPSLSSVERPNGLDLNGVLDDKHVLYSKGKMAKPLKSGEQLKNGWYVLKMQDDCNLVLFNGKWPRWSTKTAGQGTNCYCKLATNSNLEVRDGDNRRVWATTTHHKTARPGSSEEYVFVLHNDGIMNIYDTPIWRTGTSIPDNYLNITAEAFVESNGIASVV